MLAQGIRFQRSVSSHHTPLLMHLALLIPISDPTSASSNRNLMRFALSSCSTLLCPLWVTASIRSGLRRDPICCGAASELLPAAGLHGAQFAEWGEDRKCLTLNVKCGLRRAMVAFADGERHATADVWMCSCQATLRRLPLPPPAVLPGQPWLGPYLAPPELLRSYLTHSSSCGCLSRMVPKVARPPSPLHRHHHPFRHSAVLQGSGLASPPCPFSSVSHLRDQPSSPYWPEPTFPRLLPATWVSPPPSLTPVPCVPSLPWTCTTCSPTRLHVKLSEYSFVIYTFSRKGLRAPNTWRLEEYVLSSPSPEVAKDWVSAINNRVRDIRDRCVAEGRAHWNTN